jgi:thiol:disulfide interchange protein DsbD
LIVPSLVADTTAVTAGKPFTVGVRMKMKSGWHTYWQFPGDAGDPPKIDWQLPDGFKAGPIQWPIPKSEIDDPDLLSYIFPDEVLLMVEITPPAQLAGSEVDLHAKLRWLVCEKTCIPGKGEVDLKLPAGGEAAPANAELFAEWRARLPKTSGAPFQASWDRSKADAFSLKLDGLKADQKVEFFPLPAGKVNPDPRRRRAESSVAGSGRNY